MKDTSLGYIARCLLIALLSYGGLNVVVFCLFFGNTLMPLSLPYAENFDQLSRLDYRQFGGTWSLRDGTLVQSVENDTDLMAVIPVTLKPGEAYHFQAHLNFLSGLQGGGLMFNLQHRSNRQSSHMVRFGSDQGRSYLVYGYFDEAGNFSSQGDVNPFDLSGAANGVDLAVDVHDRVYDILVNGAVVAPGIPLIHDGGTLALTTWFSSIAFDDVRIELRPAPALPAENIPPPVSPTSAAVVPAAAGFSDAFEGADHSRWQPFSGTWTFESGALVQTDSSGFDYGIAANEPVRQFKLTAQFTHRQGMGGGVLFSMPQRDSARGAHMVRYFENNHLVWGYFDENGAFQGQGDAAVPAPGTTAHQIEISADGSEYAIRLDGSEIAAHIPLHNAEGYIGLTASQSVVAFEQVTVEAAEPVPDVLANSVTSAAAGTWNSANGVTLQQAVAAPQAYSSIGMFGETFTVSVEITLPDTPSAAGLIFHAPDATQPGNSHAVRVQSDGQLAWGMIDARQQFQPQGSVPVTLSAGKHTLALEVRAAEYDILLDGTLAANALPLTDHEGWLFFDAVNGPVAFANFTLNLTGIGS